MSENSEEIVSPCIGVCAISEASGQCAGCFRTLEEIQNWWDMSASQRDEVMKTLDKRQEEAFNFGD